MKLKTIIIAVLSIFGIFFLKEGLKLVGYYFGAARFKHIPLEPGYIEVPHERTICWRDHSTLTKEILQHWVYQELEDWQKEGKTKVPRIILAKLAMKHDLERVNTYLQNQAPRGRSGSTWLLHPEGDYDFTLAVLTVILYLYGDEPEILFPATREHLLSGLLIEEGGNPRVNVPRSLGLVRDTENHLLMTEGSRYLKNRWMALHGNNAPKYNNVINGLEQWMLIMLGELQEAGLYEFNSMPYLGYTMTALMNLEAFGSDQVKQAAREILDRLNWEYALGSLSLRRCAPFRRKLTNTAITSLNSDYHTALMKVWMSLKEETSFDLTMTNGLHHALMACVLPYRPADKVVQWVEKKLAPYFIRIGHGKNASPEIYSGGPGYLISAGGVHRGWRSLIVARPITLMLEDGVDELNEVIHLKGPGKKFSQWNNTGVYKDFACAAGPVYIPNGWTTAVENDLWAVYRKNDSLCIAIHSRQDLGILCLFHNTDAEKVIGELTEANSDPEILYRQFQRPHGERITYDVESPKIKWVIVSAGGHKLDRNYDRWGRMEGNWVIGGMGNW